jgi:hypothetical protein
MLAMIADRSDQNAPNQASRFTMHVRNLKGATLKTAGRSDTLETFTVDSPIPYKMAELVSLLRIDNEEMVAGTGSRDKKGEWNVSVRGTHGLSSRPKPGTVAVLRPAQGWVLALSVRDGLALAVSMALPLLGIAPVARQEPREVVRTASTRGSASSASGRSGVGAGINSIGNRRDLQMAEKYASCVLIRNINATIMAIGVDASGDTKSSAVAHVSRCGL